MSNRIFRVIAVFIVLLFVITGCGNGAQKESKNGNSESTSTAPAEKQNSTAEDTGKQLQIKEVSLSADIAAKVNGVIITTADFERRVHKTKFVFNAKGYKFDGPDREKQLAELQEQVMNELVIEELVNQEAEKQGVAATDEQAKAAVEQIKSRFDSPETYRKTMESRGLNEEAMVKYFKYQLTRQGLERKIGNEAQFNQQMQQKYLQAKVEINKAVVQQIIEKG